MARRKTGDNRVAVGNVTDVSGEVNIAGGDIYKGYTVEQVSILLTQITTTMQRKPFDGRCPYKGLEFFEEEDAEFFFGRERLVKDLVSRVKQSRTLFVTGPSGSGKSSLVRAGLIHALKQGSIRELHSERWSYETMKPGREPLQDLALVFSRLKSPELAKYFLAHVNEISVLHDCAESVLSERKNQRFVLFIDQFEEVFTQVSAEEERQAFLDILAHAATVDGGRVILLFAMRSDFVSNCAIYPGLNELLCREFRQIGAMQPDELVSAIALPARHVGLQIEDELIARIINDMKGEPGALPLMQFALKDLFAAQQAKGGIIALRLEEYDRHGGIHNSLERHANQSFARFNPGEQQLARSIFSGLIEIGRGTSDTRRTALFDELVPANAKPQEVQAIVTKLADARLIITDEQAGKDTVTISHEKLIDAWPWLKKLVNENRDVIALQNEVASDAKEWDDHGRDPSYLYRGARLGNACEKLEAKALVLSDLAQTFVQAGNQLEAMERSREEARRQKELEDARRLADAQTQRAEEQARSASKLRQQARYLTIALFAALIAAGAAIFFGYQSRRQTTIARSGELAALVLNFRENQPVLSLLMGIESFRLQDDLRSRSMLIDNLNLNPQIVQYFSGESTKSTAVAFSPDGKVLASAGNVRSIDLWDVPTGKRLGILRSEIPGIVLSIAFSPDGKILAAGDDQYTLTLYDLKTLSPLGQPLEGHTGVVRSVAFSPDGKLLASGSADKKIIVWDIQTGQPIGQPFVGHEDSIYSIAFSGDGKTIASGSVDRTVRIWDVQTHKPIGQPFTGHTHWVKSIAFSPDGRILASGSVDETIRLWDVKTQRQIGAPLANHSGEIRSVAFSPDGKTLASGSADKSILLWDVQSPDRISPPFTGHTDRVVSIAFSPDGKTLASAGDDGLTILWNAHPHLSMGQFLEGHPNSVTSLAFSPDGKILASASNDQTIILRDSQTHRSIGQPIAGYPQRVLSIAFSVDSKTLAAGYADGAIVLWDVESRSPIGAPLIGHSKNITSLAYSTNGKILASSSLDNTIILWDAETHHRIGQPLAGHSEAVWSIAFSPDSKILASAGGDHHILLWDLETQEQRGAHLDGHSNRISSLAFSPDGKVLASGGFDKTIILWQVASGESDRISKDQDAFVTALAFSRDGKTLASSGADNTVILWDFATRQRLGQPLSGHPQSITSLAFSPDSKSLVSGDNGGAVILWHLDPEFWIQKSCQRAGRNITSNEWAQYFRTQEYRLTCAHWPPEN